jgi:hypothetical protein
MKLTEQISNLSKRVGALESQDLDDAAGIATIKKLYGNVKLIAKVTVSVHQYHVCSTTLPCSESLII